jgi:Na+/alanine symporter
MLGISHAVLAYVALGAGAVATLSTILIQVRGLRSIADRSAQARSVRRATLAAGVGMGSVCGAAFAVSHGGPGAIAWMWLASLLGMALAYGETLLSLRMRAPEDGDAPGPLVYLKKAFGPAGKLSATLFGLAALAFALAAGAAFQGQQGGRVIGELLGAPPIAVSIALAILAAPFLLLRGPRFRKLAFAAAPAIVVAYVALLIAALASGTGGVGDHLSIITGSMFAGEGAAAAGATGGGIAMVMQWGVLRATLAGQAGLGTAGLAAEAESPANPDTAHRAGAGAMLLPLVSGVLISTLTALALMSHQVESRQRIDDPMIVKEGEADPASAPPRFSPLERPHSRGSKASMARGQTFVLPVDTPLEKGKTYPMVMRANPRGHLFGKVSPLDDKNVTVISDFGIAENIDTIVFRDAHELRRHQSGYDLRIPVKRTVHRMKDAELVALEPLDPEYDLKTLKLRMMGPYLVLDDLHFQGTVATAFSPDPNVGEHKAMFEHRPEDARLNPVLRTFLSLGYRGPYFDDEGEPPPYAMIAAEDFDAPLGSRLKLRMESPARGLETGQMLPTIGVLRVPAWDFLAETEFAVLRHNDDPAKDRIVPVQGKLEKDFLRFTSAQPEVVDFKRADSMKDFTGPYLLPPPYEFEVEVHTAARAPDPPGTPPIDHNLVRGVNFDRKTLVPVHAPLGTRGEHGELYSPHPAEVAQVGMQGPYLVREPSAQVSALFSTSLGAASKLAALVVALLAMMTLVGWGHFGASVASHLAGDTAGLGFRVLFLAAAVAGAVMTGDDLLASIDAIMLPMLAINAVGVCLLLPRLRKTGASQTTDASEETKSS